MLNIIRSSVITQYCFTATLGSFQQTRTKKIIKCILRQSHLYGFFWRCWKWGVLNRNEKQNCTLFIRICRFRSFDLYKIICMVSIFAVRNVLFLILPPPHANPLIIWVCFVLIQRRQSAWFAQNISDQYQICSS